ncbi:uncharacterized protein OCT59_009467 [Rhizophagus irregularis]|uniref:Uncharacterized protein n=1 Tax=Rhizophagus irregularis TaxID=588596 RepID=A0A916E1N9_9GLOM|nr:hypothetical protein OCT59_009467 [Rhizophagus irregularis]GET59507.1 hypothetical protein RIR_jg1344.t1 [Rhizophagus irregularis DAOM 181602=DAOM 197198]CAB4480414.1 unnamed protein product [Rhizophagus irregularis]CAB5332732.1 unnamed protein product [Rhizophagus irregularis]
MYKTVKYWTSPEGIPEENIHTISEFFSPGISKLTKECEKIMGMIHTGSFVESISYRSRARIIKHQKLLRSRKVVQL